MRCIQLWKRSNSLCDQSADERLQQTQGMTSSTTSHFSSCQKLWPLFFWSYDIIELGGRHSHEHIAHDREVRHNLVRVSFTHSHSRSLVEVCTLSAFHVCFIRRETHFKKWLSTLKLNILHWIYWNAKVSEEPLTIFEIIFLSLKAKEAFNFFVF